MAGQITCQMLSNCTHQMKEGDLTSIFRDWQGKKCGWRVGSVPDWLASASGRCQIATFKTQHCFVEEFSCKLEFPPWEGNQLLVMELKRHSSKKNGQWQTQGEEIALAQVLHYACQLENHPSLKELTNKRVVPVVVTSYSSWMRGPLCYLFRHGFKEDSLKYLEVTFLKENDSDSSGYLWFEEPFAEWEQMEPPGWIPKSSLQAYPKWYRAKNGSKSWAGTDEIIDDRQVICPKRLVIYPGKCLLLQRVLDGTGEYLAWRRAQENPRGDYCIFRVPE